MASIEEVLPKVLKLINEALAWSALRGQPLEKDTPITEDDFDALDRVELIMELEEEFAIEISDHEQDEIFNDGEVKATPESITEWLVKKMGAQEIPA